MKRSPHVPATLVVAIASGITVTGCSSGSYRDCRDISNRIVSDSFCQANTPGYHWATQYRSGGFGGYRGSSGFFGG